MVFEDIKITGLDDARSRRTDPNKAMYDMYLTLSERAPDVWGRILEEEHKSQWDNHWRTVRASGSHIIVHCPPDEIERHLETLKREVTSTNAKYRSYLAAKEQEQARKAEADQAERARLAGIKDKLKFD